MRRSVECEVVRIDFSGLDLPQCDDSKDEEQDMISSNEGDILEAFSERNSESEED